MQTEENFSFEDDLHLLMAISVIVGRVGLDCNMATVYETWSLYYPEDALGAIGHGLKLIGEGQTEEGLMAISKAAETSQTRADQARDVLNSLKHDLEEVEGV